MLIFVQFEFERMTNVNILIYGERIIAAVYDVKITKPSLGICCVTTGTKKNARKKAIRANKFVQTKSKNPKI